MFYKMHGSKICSEMTSINSTRLRAGADGVRNNDGQLILILSLKLHSGVLILDRNI